MNTDVIAEKIVRLAIGFPNKEELKKYLRKHPKADPSNHWVEYNPETKENKDVPESIGTDEEKMDLRQSVLRSSNPNAKGEYDWYDLKGEKVTDKATLFRANRLALELSLNSPSLVNVRIFVNHRPGSTKPFGMAYRPDWMKVKGAAPYKYFYTEVQLKNSNDKIMAKNIKFSKAWSSKSTEIDKDAEQGIPEAVVIRFIDKHHIRIGTQGQKNDGICTLRTKYCKVVDNMIVIKNMPTKSNQKFSGKITDPILVREIAKRLKNKGPNDLVFNDTASDKVNTYLKQKLGDDSFSSKNLRTCEATGLAYKFVTEMTGTGKKLSLKQRYAVMAKACLIASKALNNKPDVCHSNYIDPKVWEILDLPDTEYHKEYPILKIEKNGKLVFKTDAKIEKLESALRKLSNDEEGESPWDIYRKEYEDTLMQLNQDNALDNEPSNLIRLPLRWEILLLKKHLKKLERG